MATSAANALVGITGSIYKGPLATAAPTGTASTLAVGFLDLGYISEDGITLALAGPGDTTPLKVWQNGETVRTLRASSDELPTLAFTMVETKLEVVELWANATVTQTSTEGQYDYDAGKIRPYLSHVLNVIDGAELYRLYAPKAVVTDIGDQVYKGDELIGYEVTIEMEKGSGGFNFRSWSTRLKTP